ncbi:Acetyltransferase (GNAT) family protein [Lentzea xinjiangensis]|uniref:Acetyltransferase (GNAT) family protein n=1 Tax=Lentzea xinjiangensis TaxID=402600 RepID=A0A1H9MTV8_9PSEU|nr:GNAT family N-acetyltransferase [Lentzea xinjiangensis]SER27122.1 Acetyltransferase (GNAT) family protein [Lentzea xinjiangensis]
MIRRVEPRDVDAVVQLVHELALYERAPEQCHLTAEQLHTALFGDSPALFGHVAEVDGQVVGIALWFLNFSTWDGVHGIYLEDLYVTPDQRGNGIGRKLLEALAQECVAKGYTRFQWWVLNWNEPSIGFYTKLGAVPMDEWTVMRVSGEALRELAAGR